MVVVGVDVHKRTHTFVAVNEVGRQLGQLTVAATSQGHLKALGWARREFGEALVWAIEDCRAMSVRLERDLLGAGQPVVRVPPKMMASQRRTARTPGKSDPIDAAAVARAYLREPDLPTASHDEASREAKLLVDRRETLVDNRTRTINALLWKVHELDPARLVKPRSLDAVKNQKTLRAWLATLTGTLAEMALDELDDVIAWSVRIKEFDKRIAVVARTQVPTLLALRGCGDLTAAKLLGESAGITRFKSEAAFARHGGIAPIPVSSGDTSGRVRMTRTGNRQINCAIHRIAITQVRLKDSCGQAYYTRKIAEGKTKTEALRCLKRHIARTVFNHLTTDHTNRQTPSLPTAA